MPHIIYRYLNGNEVGQWPGSAYRNEEGLVRHRGQIFLGRVIDKEKMIFWKRSQGFYRFDPETQTCISVPSDELPAQTVERGRAKSSPPVIVDFGDAFFLDALVEGLQYKDVLRQIHCANTDTLLALLSFYLLDCGSPSSAHSWYRQSYAAYLYPAADLRVQAIREMLRSIGSLETSTLFLREHVKYVLANSGSNLGVVIKSAGLANGLAASFAWISEHERESSSDLRFIVVVHKNTGLPLYYEYIADNDIDVAGIDRSIIILDANRCKVQYSISDSGCSSPSSVLRLCQIEGDFIVRLSPDLELFHKVFEENRERLLRDEDLVRYGDSLLNIVKVRSEIATDTETGTKYDGYVYLCLDHQTRAKGTVHLMKSELARTKTTEEIVGMQAGLGVFAILSTRDLPVSDILPEYQRRQNIDQFLVFAKNCAEFIPEGKHTDEMLRGHLLLSFISSFLLVLIRNRLDIKPQKSVADFFSPLFDSTLPRNCCDDSWIDRSFAMPRQWPFSPLGINDAAARWFFSVMRGQKADVSRGRIDPSMPMKEAMDIYEAFGLASPLEVRREGPLLRPVYSDRAYDRGRCRSLVFPQSLRLGESENPMGKRGRDKAAPSEMHAQSGTGSATCTESVQPDDKGLPKRRGGRPKGSRNKKTLERENQLAAGLLTPPAPKKRGRKPGSKDSVKRIRRTKAQLAADRNEQDAASVSHPDGE